MPRSRSNLILAEEFVNSPHRWLIAVVAGAITVSASVVSAQTATVIHSVNLRRDSSTDQAPIRLLKPLTETPTAADGLG
jgi:hypothetical protein